MRIIGLFILTIIWNSTSLAGERGHLVLRAFVPSAIATKIRHVQLSPSKSLVRFKSQINSRHSTETQKFEVQGLEQSGFEIEMKKLAGNSRTIEYEVLVNHLKATRPTSRPIFLNISAN